VPAALASMVIVSEVWAASVETEIRMSARIVIFRAE
jgi:hypothetical protein